MVQKGNMKTIVEAEQAIIKITATIYEKYPELSKFISEMPVNNSGNEVVNIKNLQEYYNSFQELLEHFAATHREGETL